MSTDVVLSVIRGEQPVSSLKKAGVHFEQRPVIHPNVGVRQLIVRQNAPLRVKPTAADLAHGLLRNLDRPKELREWGSFILAADLIDLGPLEADPHGDELLGGVWDASFNGRVSEEVLAAARSLMGQPGESVKA